MGIRSLFIEGYSKVSVNDIGRNQFFPGFLIFYKAANGNISFWFFFIKQNDLGTDCPKLNIRTLEELGEHSFDRSIPNIDIHQLIFR